MIQVKLLTPTAKCPKRAHDGDAGYDIYADSNTVVIAGFSESIDTGISVKIPDGHVGLIKPRSGLAFKNGADTMAGVIDAPYRGEIKVLLTCLHAGKAIYVEAGDRIAQLLIIPVENKSDFIVVDDFDDVTERGENGFGHTGLK